MRIANHPILYSFRRCPYAMRARMALAAAGIAVELREIVLGNKPPQLLLLSPKGTVPVLQSRDGEVIDESLDVMRWALKQHDPLGWLPTTEQLPHSLDLIAENDHAFKPLLDRYKYSLRSPQQSQQEYREQSQVHLASWEQRLQRTKGGLLTPQIGVADIAIFPFLRQFGAVEPEWWNQRQFPALHHWLQVLANSELFRSVMLKLPPWQEGQTAAIVNWQG